jgi:hypothetical protein
VRRGDFDHPGAEPTPVEERNEIFKGFGIVIAGRDRGIDGN